MRSAIGVALTAIVFATLIVFLLPKQAEQSAIAGTPRQEDDSLPTRDVEPDDGPPLYVVSDMPADEVAPSELQTLVKARGIEFGPEAKAIVSAFNAEQDDTAWSVPMEAQLVGELARSSLPVADWYVECRRGRCLLVLVLGTIGQPRQGELPNGGVMRDQRELADRLGLMLSGRAWRLTSRYDALVTLLSFHRRCSSDWKCLE